MKKTKSPYHLIVENGNWSEVIQARHDGAAWEELTTRTGYPALGMALYENSSIAVRLLLELGAPPYPQTRTDGTVWSPLWTAIAKKNYEAIDLLIQSGADPDEPHPISGRTPLLVMSQHADPKATMLLCRHGAKPNHIGIPSPLWLWVRNLRPKFINDTKKWQFPDPSPIMALLAAGARVHEGNSNEVIGMTALDLARSTWFEQPLSQTDLENAKMAFSAMERVALSEIAAEHEPENPLPNVEHPLKM